MLATIAENGASCEKLKIPCRITNKEGMLIVRTVNIS